MDNSSQSPPPGLPMLIDKLGHPLEEIRVRSLKNIFSKLEYGLVSDCDLIYDKKLLVRLLQWFNFPHNPQKSDVLNFLLRLSKHSIAAETLVDVGAVEFLSRLRPDVDPNLQSLIDQIMERLFLLPEPPAEAPAIQKCTYDYKEDNKATPIAIETKHKLQTSRLGEYQTTVQFEATTENNEEPLPHKFLEPSLHKGVDIPYLQGQLSYFETLLEQPSRLPSVGFNFSMFPWLFLTGTDKHVLLSTDSTLQSDDPQQVVTSCNFLKDVVLQDFPAEIFVQRPQIFKTLLTLTNLSDSRIQLAAVNCLQSLTANLKARIAFHQDPAMHNSRHDADAAIASRNSTQESDLGSSTPLSSDSRPSAIGQSDTQHQGDAQDWDALQSPGESQHSESENDLEEAEFLELQLMQITVPEYCVDILNQVVTLYQSNKYQIISHTTQLIHYIVDLMELSFGNIWSDYSALATKVTTNLQQFFTNFGNTVKFHHLKYSNAERKSASTFHRLAYICLAGVNCRLLKALMTPDQAAVINLPPQFVECLTLMGFDYGLATCYGSLYNVVLNYIQPMNEALYPVLTKTRDICRACEAACQFLLNHQHQKHRLQMAKDALPSLEYHKDMEYIEKFMCLLSESCAQLEFLDEHRIVGKTVLLQLLAHNSQAVRLATYRSCYGAVKEALSVKQVRNTMLTDSLKVQFVLDPDVFFEMCNFGLSDGNEHVVESARNTIMYLIQGRLLMTEDVWRRFWQSLKPVFPILQSYADTHSTFGRCITLFTNTETCSIPNIELLRGNLRLMFASDHRLRADTIRHLMWFLTREENSPERVPNVHDLDYSRVSNVFSVDQVANLITLTSAPPAYQAENLIRVFEILKSPEMEKSIKKSAVQQVSYMLEDPKLHVAFKENNGPEFLLSMIDSGLTKPNYREDKEDMSDLLPHYFHCLVMLASYDDVIRAELATNEKLYLNVLRGALVLNLEGPICLDVCHLLTLLLFNEVLEKEKRVPAPGGGDYEAHFVFALPTSAVKRYCLPFRVVESKASNSRIVGSSVEDDEPDPLLSPPAVEMLRLAWNIGWYGGLERLIEFSEPQHFTEFASVLQLTLTDLFILKTTHLFASLDRCITDIRQANNHKEVRSALYLLRLHLVALHGRDNIESIETLSWEAGLTRFLSVVPSSRADKELLYDILGFLMFIIDGAHAPLPNARKWLNSTVFNIQNELFNVVFSLQSIQRDADSNEVKPLNRQLIKFLSCIMSGMPYTDVGLSSSIVGSSGQLVHSLLQNLNLGEAPHFYNLAALEDVLHCLVHITARSGCTSGCTTTAAPALCRQMLSTLMDVVAAFHIGRGGAANSFMGRGVTKSSTLCLQHLAAEMAVQMKGDNWAQYWLCNHQPLNDSNDNLGLTWLVPLWTYRDPEVRAAGLGIAANIASSTYGCNTLTVHLQQVASGVWGAALSFLLDRSEASFVKQQAALLLVNLTAQPLPGKSGNDGNESWQGPIVGDADTQATVVGLSALLLLLHHSNFYKEMSSLTSCFYPLETIRQTPLTADVSSNSTSSAEHVASGSENNRASSTGHHGIEENQVQLPVNTQEQEPQAASISRMIHHGFASSFDSVPGSSTSSTSPHFKRLMIVTPALVSAICQLLRNLVVLAPRDTVNAMLREQLLDALVKCVDVAHLLSPRPTKGKHLKRLMLDLIEMQTSIFRLIAATLSKDNKLHVTNNLYVISMAFSSLNIKIIDAVSVKNPVFCLWTGVYVLLSVLLQANNCDVGLLFSVVRTNWSILSANLKLVLEEEVPDDLWLSALKCWTLLCIAEGKQQQAAVENVKTSIVELLEISENSHVKDMFNRPTWSAILCQLLLKKHAKVLRRPRIAAFGDRTVILNALSAMFGISNSAKFTAIKEGFTKIIIDQLKEIHSIFTMHSLDYAKKGKIKDNQAVQDLTMHLILLQNLVCGYPEGKEEASKLGLSSIIYQLWAWCIEDVKLMTTMLSLIRAFSAKCKHSNRTVAFTSPLPGSGGLKIAGTNSLVHSLLRLGQREMDRFSCTRDTAHIVLVFQILANLCFGTESRSILCKSNFLEGFTRLSPMRTKKNKHYQLTDTLWLNFFVSLSFSPEGQDAIAKLKGSIDLLVDFVQNGHAASVRSALLVLRNMCCTSCHWPRLLNCESLVPTLVSCIQNESDGIAPIAASALWALIANNQKAKTFVKTLSILPHLEQTLRHYQSSPVELPSHKVTLHALENLLKACSVKD